MSNIDPLSKASLKIIPYFNDEKLGYATGFVIKDKNNNQLYLVTNWHVVSGRNQQKGKPLDEKYSTLPNKLELTINSNKKIEIILYNNFENNTEKKRWLEYPINTIQEGITIPNVDVVLLPIESNPNIPIVDFSLMNPEITIVPAQEVSIVGFPLSNQEFPVWLKGSIATEPSININNLPLFYINASGHAGLSGSPVVARSIGYYQSDKGLNIDYGIHTKFIGIYSGRIKEFPELCQVWKPEVIFEILKNR